jgi:protein tyrosine phosphatase (PTP) superfamily phosphohydrolase (DUF442 family)
MSRALILSTLCLAVLPACSAEESDTSLTQVADVPATPVLAAPVAMENEQIHRLMQLKEGMYSGALPVGDAAFAELAALGIKTIVCVDGARPDLEAAARHGLSYIHVPIGYDGIDRDTSNAFARVAQEVEGPLYFHCHHGKHRGPAAAAIALRAATGCTTQEALAVLEVAGTSRDYPGLWRDVAGWTPPTADEVLPELHEVAQVADFTASMATLDRDWDELKALRASSWQTPEAHPDLDLRRSVKAFAEHYADSANVIPAEHATDVVLLDQMQAGLQMAEKLQLLVEEASNPPTAAQIPALEEAFLELKASCKDCHKDYRNE